MTAQLALLSAAAVCVRRALVTHGWGRPSLDAHVGALLPDLFGAGELRDQAGVVALLVAGRRIAAVARRARLDVAPGDAARVEDGRGAGRAERVGAAGLLASDGAAGVLARAGRLGVGDGLVRVGPVRLRERGAPVVVGGVAAIRVAIRSAAFLAADRAALGEPEADTRGAGPGAARDVSLDGEGAARGCDRTPPRSERSGSERALRICTHRAARGPACSRGPPPRGPGRRGWRCGT